MGKRGIENDCSCDGGLGDKDPTFPSDEQEMIDVKRLQQSFEASLTLDDSRVYKRWVDHWCPKRECWYSMNIQTGEWKWTWKKSWHWQQDEQDPTLMRKREKYCHPSCTHCPTEFMWGDWGDVVKSALDKNAEEYRKPYIPPNPTASAASSSASCGAGVPAAQAG